MNRLDTLGRGELICFARWITRKYYLKKETGFNKTVIVNLCLAGYSFTEMLMPSLLQRMTGIIADSEKGPGGLGRSENGKAFRTEKDSNQKKFQFLELNSCYLLLRWISKTTKDWEFFLFCILLLKACMINWNKRYLTPTPRRTYWRCHPRRNFPPKFSRTELSVAWESHLFPTSLQYCTHLNWGLCISVKRVCKSIHEFKTYRYITEASFMVVFISVFANTAR